VLALLHLAVSIADLDEGENLVDNHLDLTRFEKRPDAVTKALGDRGLLFNGPGAQSRAGDREPSHHHRQKVEFRNLAAPQKRDLNQPALEGEQPDVPWQVVASDHVEDNIDSMLAGMVLDLSDEVPGSVVDGQIRPQFSAELRLLVAANRGEDLGPVLLRKLNSHVTDPA